MKRLSLRDLKSPAQLLEYRLRMKGRVLVEPRSLPRHVVPEMHAVTIFERECLRAFVVIEQQMPVAAANRVQVVLGPRFAQVTEIAHNGRQSLGSKLRPSQAVSAIAEQKTALQLAQLHA